MLTQAENNDLSELKQKMGLLLAVLQTSKMVPDLPAPLPKRRVRRERSVSTDVRSQQDNEVVIIEEHSPSERRSPAISIDEAGRVVVGRVSSRNSVKHSERTHEGSLKAEQ